VNYSVFIVEDDPMVADINRRVIELIQGFRVVGASSSEGDALNKIFKLAPDLVLLDIYLQSGSGITILRKIRESELATDIILVTAAKDVQTIYSTLRFGAIDYIIKPFDLERLRSSLNSYTNMRKILNKKMDIKQEELDRIGFNTGALRQEIEHGGSLPKGVHQITLEQILTLLIKEKRPLTCQDIATRLSISKITIWRYVEYLVEKKRIQYNLQYGSHGRPSKTYFVQS
jgi:two-component system response regulator DctR